MVCEWEEIMSEMVLVDRYEIKKPIARILAIDIRKSFEAGTADLENLLKEKDLEIFSLQEKLEKYEPALKPEKYS